MRILFISISFAPDNSPNAHAVTPLVNGLVDLGHEVTVLTTMPHRGANSIYDGYRGKLWVTEKKRPRLRVCRTWVYVPKRSDWHPGTILRWLSFNLPVTPLSLAIGQHDVVFTLSPPFSLGLTAWMISAVQGIPYIYNAQDIYPDVAIQQGLLQEGKVASAIDAMCDFIYQRAAYVTVLTEGFRQNLLSKGVSPQKVQVIPNLVDTEVIRPGPHRNSFSEQYDLNGKFVVMYAGNVGDSLGIEAFFETVRLLRKRGDILFVVVGRGTALPRLREMCESAGLTNIRFLPYQSKEALSSMYASSDLQLVLQRSGFSRVSAPMKAYAIMSSGRPMLVSADLDGDTANLVDQANCGVCVPPEQPELLASAIEGAVNSPEQLVAWGNNGREYVVNHFSKEAIAGSYDRLFREVVS